MGNKANSPDHLLPIYDDLTRAFNSVDSFCTYYNNHLAATTPNKWGKELEQKIFEIHTYMKGVFVEKVKSETVLLWLNKVVLLKGDIDAIAYRIDTDLKEKKAYEDLPEAVFREEVILEDIRKTGKSYEELEPIYLRQIQNEIKFLSAIRPYSEKGLKIISRSLQKMKSIFEPIIKFNSENVLLNKKINKRQKVGTPMEEKTASEKKSIPPPIGMENVATFILQDSRLRISALHEKLASPPAFLQKNTLQSFEKLFNGKIESFTLEWKGNTNQLSYFVKTLIKKDIIERYGAWIAAQKHFTLKGRHPGPHLHRAKSIGKEAKINMDAVLKVLPSATTI